MSTSSRTTTTSSPPIPISPFTIYSDPSEATSDETPDLGAFTTVLREWNHLQPPLRIPRFHTSSSSATTRTAQTLPTDAQTPIEGSTVWNHLPIDTYFDPHSTTTNGAQTNSPPLSPPQSSSPPYPPHRWRSHSDGEFDYNFEEEGTESARTVEIDSELDADFDLSMEQPPSIKIEDGFSDNVEQQRGDDRGPEAPSLGYLEAALNFIAAERARWAAQREAGTAAPDLIDVDTELSIKSRKRRRQRRRPSKRRGADGASAFLSAEEASIGLSQSTSPITPTTSSSLQEASVSSVPIIPFDPDLREGSSAGNVDRDNVEEENPKTQVHPSKQPHDAHIPTLRTRRAEVDLSDTIDYEESRLISSGLGTGIGLRNAKSTPHLRSGVVEESESSAADSRDRAIKPTQGTRDKSNAGTSAVSDAKSSSIHHNPSALSPSATTSSSVTASKKSKTKAKPLHVISPAAIAEPEVDSSSSPGGLHPQPPHGATLSFTNLAGRPLTLHEQHERFQQRLREHHSKTKIATEPSISQAVELHITHQHHRRHRSRSTRRQKSSSFGGSTGSPISPVGNKSGYRMGDDETILSSLSNGRRWKLHGLTKKLIQAFPEDRDDLDRVSRQLVGKKGDKLAGDGNESGLDGARLKSEDEILVVPSKVKSKTNEENINQKEEGRLIHVFIDHSNILIGLLSYLKRHPIQKKLQRGSNANTNATSISSTTLSASYQKKNISVYNSQSSHNIQDTNTYGYHGAGYTTYDSSNAILNGYTYATTSKARGAFSSTEEEGYGNSNYYQRYTRKKNAQHKSTHFSEPFGGGELGFVNAVLESGGYTSGSTNYYSDGGKGDSIRGGTRSGSEGLKKKFTKKMWHAALALILERGRPIQRRVVVTSSPLYQPLDAMERLGYEVRIYLRVPDLGDGMDRDRERYRAGLPVPNVAAGRTDTNTRSGTTISRTTAATNGRTSPPTPSSSPTKQSFSGAGGSFRSKKRKGRADLGSIGGFVTDEGVSSASSHYGRHLGTSPSNHNTINLGISPPKNAQALSTPQRVKYREQGVDELLQLKLHQALAATDEVPEGATIVLATGDGNVGQFNEDGFLGPVRTALRRGWRVELVAWEGGLSRAWKREFGEGSEWWEKGMFRVIHLEQFASFLVDADDELI
ncbi:hypothetical protein AX16_005126 [Volvariella volvacea WC 439]|nr:hypothetical protein AX16_005126 [Volvariella volvacea WC 439]